MFILNGNGNLQNETLSFIHVKKTSNKVFIILYPNHPKSILNIHFEIKMYFFLTFDLSS
jgi:hypothetical protein